MTARYGNVVMLGEKNATFAPIYDKSMSLEEITLEESLDILDKRENILNIKKIAKQLK